MRRPVIAAILVAAACAPTVTARRLADVSALPAVPADSVRVFADTSEVPKPYTVVGHLDTRTGPIISQKGVVPLLRRRAGEMGANALVYPRKYEFGLGISGDKNVLALRYQSP